MSKEWIAGFIEGEGNFNVALVKKFKTHSWEYPFEFYPVAQFRIFLREDDLEVLKKIKHAIGVGKIYKKSYEYSRKKGINSRDQYAYYITSLRDLHKLREFLGATTFHSKKKSDMEKFFEIVDLKASKAHLTKEGNEKILELAREMNSHDRANFQVKPVTE